MDNDREDKNRERKTVRFNPNLQVVFVEQENEPDRIYSLSFAQPTVHQRVKEHQLPLLRGSRPRQQPRPLALPPTKGTNVWALIDQILEKPLDPSPPTSPSAVTSSSSSSSSPPPPPPLPLLSKQQPLPKSKLLLKPKPRANNSLSVTSRDVQRFRRDLAIVDGLSGSAGLAAKRGKAAKPSRFFQPLCMHPHVPPRFTSNAAAVAVATTMIDFGQDTHGKPRVPECQSEKVGENNSKKCGKGESEKGGDDSGEKHKGRCKKRNGRCKKCERTANRPQGDGNGDGGVGDNDHGCGMEILQFTIQCMGCTIA